MTRYVFSFFLSIVFTFPVFSQSIISNEEFKTALDKGDHSVWHRFSDFEKVYSFLTADERKDYEWAQRAVFESDQRGEEILRSLDLIAFKRAYPELSKLLNDTLVERSFYDYYQKKYSYGWLRRKAWFSRRLTDPGKKSSERFKTPVFIDQSRSYLKTKEGLLPDPKRFLALSYDQLLTLAICNGYKPAVLDIVRASRVQGQLKLSVPLSYLLMVRVKQKKMRVIFKEKWLKEIDAVLSEQDKQKYRSLLKQKDKLAKTISYCKA